MSTRIYTVHLILGMVMSVVVFYEKIQMQKSKKGKWAFVYSAFYEQLSFPLHKHSEKPT